MSEAGKNTIRLRRLLAIGATWPDLVEEIADLIDSKDSPHIASFFQLPYPLHLTRDWHRVRGSQGNPSLHLFLQPRLVKITVDEFVKPSIRELSEKESVDGATITQMVALIPLWDSRLRFYPDYLRCVSDEDLRNRVIVPKEFSWVPDSRAISSSAYEHDLCRRAYRLIETGLRYLLPSYSIVSLTEAPLPHQLNNYFTMPAPGRVIHNRAPTPVWSTILGDLPRAAAPHVTSAKLQTALKGGFRELGKFEHQLLAMNRLRLEGEKALALIGTLSLLEWFLNLHFVDQEKIESRRKKNGKKWQGSVNNLLNEGHLSFLSREHQDFLAEAAESRNSLIHGAPPNRHPASGSSKGANREREYEGNAISSAFVEKVIRTALDVFRIANLKRLGRL